MDSEAISSSLDTDETGISMSMTLLPKRMTYAK